MKRQLPYLTIGLFVAGLQLFGVLNPIDNLLEDQRFRLDGRAATGNVVLVDIDSRSLQAINVWPWPRSIHGAVLDRLVLDGAETIAFDIDFSSRSSDIEDRAFADALDRANGRVIMAGLQQFTQGVDEVDYLSFNAPIEVFRQHVTTALVNVFPGTDAFIRSFPAGASIDGVPYSSLPNALAQIPYAGQNPFRIDYGIRPDTFPRVSVVDVLAGNIPEGTFDGKAVIVGATAIELGDQFAAPVYGIIDGPVLQALAYETLVQERDILVSGPLFALSGVLLIVLFWPMVSRFHWGVRAIFVVTVLSASQVIAFWLYHVGSVSFETAAFSGALLGCFAFDLIKDIERQAITIFEQRLLVVQRERTLQRIVSDSFDGIVTANEDGLIELFNEAAESLSGISGEEATGRDIDDIIDGASQPVRESVDAGDMEPGPLLIEPVELELLRGDETRIPVELSVSRSFVPVVDSRHRKSSRDRTIYTYTFRDISSRKRAELELLTAKENAESANRAKTEFLANMSHELRTPLNAVIGFSELMKEESFGPLGDEQYLEYSGLIHDSGNHLLSVINDILDISRIETGTFELNEEPFDINAALDGCIRLSQGWQARQPRKLAIDIASDLPWVLGDERLIRQITLNLLSNAFKFTEDGKGFVSLRAVVSATGGLSLEVADNGIGIPEDDIPHLTEPFYQVDGTLARTHDGTGLGLSLVKTFVEAHEGKLSISSKVGVGTRVKVELPASRMSKAQINNENDRTVAILAS